MATEKVRVFEANTHFGRTLRDKDSMARLLGDGALTLGAFNEVAPGRRDWAAEAIAAHGGYRAVFPEDTNLDTVWAVSNDLDVVSEQAFPFRSRLQQMGGKGMGDRQRGVGVHGIMVTTPGGRRVRGSHQHPSPPVLEPFRRPQVRAVHQVLAAEGYFAPDDETLDVNIGDNNHYPRPGRLDRRILGLGYQALCDGSGTYDMADRHPRAAKWMGRLGAVTMPQLDAVYGRPPRGGELVSCADEDAPRLAPHQIGYQTQRVRVASDHLATELLLHLPAGHGSGHD